MQGGTWSHVGRLQLKKAVLCASITALYTVCLLRFGGFYTLLLGVVVLCSFGLCLCGSGTTGRLLRISPARTTLRRWLCWRRGLSQDLLSTCPTDPATTGGEPPPAP